MARPPRLACPCCGSYDSKVTNSRGVVSQAVGVVRRRRLCVCGARYSTVERLIRDSVRPPTKTQPYNM